MNTPDDPIEAILPAAVTLAVAVAEFDPDEVGRVLTRLDRDQLYALAVVLAAHTDLDRPMTVDLPDPVTPARTIARAVNVAAEMFQVAPDLIVSDDRRRATLDARGVAMTALRMCGLSSTVIGHAFGKDHSTVLHAAGRVGESRRLYGLARRVAFQCGWKRPDETEDVA